MRRLRIPAALNLVAVVVFSALLVVRGEAEVSGRLIDHLSLKVEPKVLNPIREKNVTGKIAVTAVYRDGSQRVLKASEVVITARTKHASGNVDVVAIEGGKVVPREGGVATVETVVTDGGNTFKAAVDVVVTPYCRDYHQTLVLKLFLGLEGESNQPMACQTGAWRIDPGEMGRNPAEDFPLLARSRF